MVTALALEITHDYKVADGEVVLDKSGRKVMVFGSVEYRGKPREVGKLRSLSEDLLWNAQHDHLWALNRPADECVRAADALILIARSRQPKRSARRLFQRH
jgi:hypothetical protein